MVPERSVSIFASLVIFFYNHCFQLHLGKSCGDHIFIFQRNISLMKPWIVLTAIGLVLNIISMALSLFVNPLTAVTTMAPWALNTSFFLVVLSFKKEIEAGVGSGEVVKA